MMIYFTGHEKESDLAEGIYTTEYRLYDARVGRWLSVDPLFEKYVGMSPYNYCMLNPLVMVDPDGRDFTDLWSKEGKAAIGGLFFGGVEAVAGALTAETVVGLVLFADGGAKVLLNAGKIAEIWRTNDEMAKGMPTNIGQMIGKACDGSTTEVGKGQEIGGYINDVASILVGSGSSINSLRKGLSEEIGENLVTFLGFVGDGITGNQLYQAYEEYKFGYEGTVGRSYINPDGSLKDGVTIDFGVLKEVEVIAPAPNKIEE